MGLTYYDNAAGRQRIKRRYVWAFWGYFSGVLTVLVLASLF